MLTAHFLLTSTNDESDTHEVFLSFDEDDVATLRRYSKNCDRLEKAELLTTGLPHIQNILMSVESGVSFTVTDFTYPSLCELLHLSRPIFLFSESASFDRTMAVIGKAGKGSVLGKYLKHIRGTYELGEYGRYFQITVNHVPLFSDKAFQIWLNGVEYHQDEEKAAIIKSIESTLSKEATRGLFAAHLSGRVRAVFKLNQLVSMILEKPGAAQ